MNLFLVGMLFFIALSIGLYIFVKAKPATLARAIRTFTTTFAALAGTGLLLTGRIGLAIITVGAAIMALRAFRGGGSGQYGWTGSGGASPSGQGPFGSTSEIVTDTLAMTLDHQTGDLDGDVLNGMFAGRSLSSLGLQDLLQLLMTCQRDDPRSVPLLETYLDRHQPDWRSHVAGDQGGHGHHDGMHRTGTEMDEATACSILNIPPTASVEEIKDAHRRLMNKLHPDHGGSSYLAAQLNQAKEVLLRR
ncbi:MAG: DnaJ domain-containing protein [Geminicoccaceae bacterium]